MVCCIQNIKKAMKIDMKTQQQKRIGVRQKTPEKTEPRKVEKAAEEQPERKFISRKSAVILFCVFWIPIFLYCLPGNILWDTVSAMIQFLKIDYMTQSNPYFLNFLFGSVAYVSQTLGDINIGVMVYCILQGGLMIYLLADIICWAGTRNRIAGYVLLLFYGLVPVFPIYSMTMSKDSCFAAAILLYVSLAIRSLNKQDFWQNDRNTLLFSLSILLMTLFRNHAGWIPAVTFILYAVFALKQKKMVFRAAVVLALVSFLAIFLPKILRIPPAETKENMSVPLQTMAFYAQTHPDDMTEEDKAIISRVIPYEDMLAKFDPDISDPLKNISTFNKETTGPFIRLWLQKLVRHPETMISGFSRSTSVYIDPAGYCKIRVQARLGFDGLSSTKQALGLKNNNPNLSILNDYVNGWLNTPVLHLFVKIGLFSIVLGICVLLMIIFKHGRYMFCAAPLLMVFVGCLLSPVNGYYRYAYPMIIGVPFLFVDMITTIAGKIRKNELRPLMIKRD